MRRICFIGFYETFEGANANRHLFEELCEELPGIFNWVYDGYKRLRENMAFTETEENKELLEDYMNVMDAVEAFFNENSDELTGEWQSNGVYMKYTAWCKDTGHTPQTRQKFTRNFKQVLSRRRPGSQVTRNSRGYLYVIAPEVIEPPHEELPEIPF